MVLIMVKNAAMDDDDNDGSAGAPAINVVMIEKNGSPGRLG